MPSPVALTTPLPGQVWRPRVAGKGSAKLVLRVGEAGSVYAIRYPKPGPGVLTVWYTAEAWREWVEKYGAKPEPESAND